MRGFTRRTSVGLGLYNKGGGLSSFKSDMLFWSDGTVDGSELTDLSGKDNHGTVTSNIITDPGFEFGSEMVNWLGADTVESSTEQSHSGTKSCKFEQTNAPAPLKGARYQYFRTRNGEEINWSFWLYLVTGSTQPVLQVLKGDGSVAWQAAAAATFDSWVQYSGSFVEDSEGGVGEIRGYITTGTITSYFDDLSITVTGQSQLGVYMADDTDMKTADENNLFYTSGGVPITLRTDIGDPTIENELIFNGGTLSYLFWDSLPDVNKIYACHNEFVDHDWVFDSCENVFTVGAGKDYTDVQSAFDAATNVSATNRYRIELYDDVSATVVGDYTEVVSGSYKDIFIAKQKYLYLDGIGVDRAVTGTLPDSASDADMTYYALCDWFYTGGARNIIFTKDNGRYAIHLDAGSLVEADVRFYKCEFHNLGMDGIVQYRIDNTLPLPVSVGPGGITPLGMGTHNGFNAQFVECAASGIHALTSHSDLASGAVSYMYFFDFTLTAEAIYQPTYNPSSEVKESIRVDGSVDTVKSVLYIMKSTLNNGIESTSSWTIYTK